VVVLERPHHHIATRDLVVVAFTCQDSMSRLQPLRQSVAEALGATGRVIRAYRGVVTAVCELAAEDSADAVERLRCRIAQGLAENTVSAGVARPRKSAATASLAILQAEQAVLLGRALYGDGNCTAFDDLGPFRFILGQPARDIREFCNDVLGLLATSDRGYEDELLGTLEVWLRSRHGVNEVARKLYLHRNTVRQRLQRVAQLTGTDLDDPDQRLTLHMAILGRRALEHLAPAMGCPVDDASSYCRRPR
jgi:DNA-binding PucR family transcriptional regulator